MIKYIYLIWALIVFSIVFVKDGLSLDNLTHIGILVFFFAEFLVPKLRTDKPIKNPKFYFISRCILNAAAVEGFYMISKPLFPGLRITIDMSAVEMLRNYMIDLLFTLPAYLLIFYVIWKLINKYEYSLWEFAILMALGQALGDGNRTFFLNPVLLLFLPYVMVNYHAMNVVPFLKVRDLLSQGRMRNGWTYVLPILLIPATYFFSAVVIFTLADLIHIK